MSRFPGAGVVGVIELRGGKWRLLLPVGCSVERRNRSFKYDVLEKKRHKVSGCLLEAVRGIAHCDGEYLTREFYVNRSR
jgi:hypothetical protein